MKAIGGYARSIAPNPHTRAGCSAIVPARRVAAQFRSQFPQLTGQKARPASRHRVLHETVEAVRAWHQPGVSPERLRVLPDNFGPYTTCYNRFVRWRRAGVWARLMSALAGAHDAAVQMIDTSIVRVHQHGACITRNRRQSMGRSRGGLTSKTHALVDTNGLPVRLALTAGEAHDNRLAGKLLSRLRSKTMLLADRGYDADWIRSLAAVKGAWANIPPRCNRTEPICFSPYLYRARNLVERFFNKIKHCRRVATRYDKLAANYLAFVQLASIRL
jgi:transposase